MTKQKAKFQIWTYLNDRLSLLNFHLKITYFNFHLPHLLNTKYVKSPKMVANSHHKKRKMCLWSQLLEWLHWKNAITLIPARFCIKWVFPPPVRALYQSHRLRLVQYIGQQKPPTCLHWKSPIWIYWDKL